MAVNVLTINFYILCIPTCFDVTALFSGSLIFCLTYKINTVTKSIKSVDSNIYTGDRYRRLVKYNLQNVENCINYYYCSDLHILLYQMAGFGFSIDTCSSTYDIQILC